MVKEKLYIHIAKFTRNVVTNVYQIQLIAKVVVVVIVVIEDGIITIKLRAEFSVSIAVAVAIVEIVNIYRVFGIDVGITSFHHSLYRTQCTILASCLQILR